MCSNVCSKLEAEAAYIKIHLVAADSMQTTWEENSKKTMFRSPVGGVVGLSYYPLCAQWKITIDKHHFSKVLAMSLNFPLCKGPASKRLKVVVESFEAKPDQKPVVFMSSFLGAPAAAAVAIARASVVHDV